MAVEFKSRSKGSDTYLVLELDVLLKLHQVPLKDVPTKAKKVEKWKEIKASLNPPLHIRSGWPKMKTNWRNLSPTMSI